MLMKELLYILRPIQKVKKIVLVINDKINSYQKNKKIIKKILPKKIYNVVELNKKGINHLNISRKNKKIKLI